MVFPRISEDMSSEPPSARWLVRELIKGTAARSDSPDDVAAVALEACKHTYGDLARELGIASAQALVNRAQAQAALQYPALLEVRLFGEHGMKVPSDSIPENRDDDAIAVELEALLEALLALLGRFVGIGIVVRLLAPREEHHQTLNED